MSNIAELRALAQAQNPSVKLVAETAELQATQFGLRGASRHVEAAEETRP